MTDQAEELAALTTQTELLGLAPGRVAIHEHEPEWADIFAHVLPRIDQALDGLQAIVEHVGSTSVPGLAAKPILDIAIGAVPPLDAQPYIDRLEATGFTFQADLGIFGGLFFTATTNQAATVAHVHVVTTDDFQWRWYLGFRDALRADPRLRSEYQKLKTQAARAHPDDRAQYTQAKVDWIQATLAEINSADELS